MAKLIKGKKLLSKSKFITLQLHMYNADTIYMEHTIYATPEYLICYLLIFTNYIFRSEIILVRNILIECHSLPMSLSCLLFMNMFVANGAISGRPHAFYPDRPAKTHGVARHLVTDGTRLTFEQRTY